MAEYNRFISQGTVNYLLQQFPEHAHAWLVNLPEEIEKLSRKWKLEYTGHELNSRFGTILYADSAVYGEVAVKIVPWFSPRLESEILCYRLLPYREMCPLLDVDHELGAMLLKYVHPAKDADIKRREKVFASLCAAKKPAAGDIALPKYENVLESALDNAFREAGGDERLCHFFESIEKARSAVKHFETEPRYIIHGDAHEYNMIMSEDGCVLIDPLGYIAPFEFEYARYLGTAMKETTLSNEAFFELVGRVLPGEANLEKCLTAFAVDVTLRACNTFIEGNTFDEIVFAGCWAQRAWRYLEAYKNQ